MYKVLKNIENNFIILILSISCLGMFFPEKFLWIKPHIPKFLGVIMFCMGITLKFSDFVRVWIKPKLILTGLLMQYLIMPILALLISKLLNLPEEFMIGMIIVGSCPGGTASNVITYLARANVALSVSMTLVSTLIAPIVTPAIIYLILSKTIDISFIAMVKSVFWIVVFPLIDGLIIRHFVTKKSIVDRLAILCPSISMFTICMLVGCIVALNKALLLTFPILIIVAAILHNGFGFGLSYFIAKLLNYEENDSRAIAIEVGMQNSGLGVSLAIQFFTATTALASAIVSIWQNLAGSMLANFWRNRSAEK